MTAYLPLEERLEVGRHRPSVLFPAGHQELTWCREEPAYFADLNLDQLVRSVIGGRQEYDLGPFFYTRLSTPEAIVYRHEALRDLEDGRTHEAISSFADRMSSMRRQLEASARLRYPVQRQAQHLAACTTYLGAVRTLTDDLEAAAVHSPALGALRDYLDRYVRSSSFAALQTDADHVRSLIADVRYRLHISGARVEVSRPEPGEGDYAADVTGTFARLHRVLPGPVGQPRRRGHRGARRAPLRRVHRRPPAA